MTKMMYAHLYTWNSDVSVKTPCFSGPSNLQMWTLSPPKSGKYWICLHGHESVHMRVDWWKVMFRDKKIMLKIMENSFWETVKNINECPETSINRSKVTSVAGTASEMCLNVNYKIKSQLAYTGRSEWGNTDIIQDASYPLFFLLF